MENHPLETAGDCCVVWNLCPASMSLPMANTPPENWRRVVGSYVWRLVRGAYALLMRASIADSEPSLG